MRRGAARPAADRRLRAHMSQWIANLLLQVSLYMLWAIPFGVIYSTFRVFHLAHGAVYLVGGYAAAFAMIGIGQTSAPGHAGVTALAVGCLAGGLAAALTGVAINRDRKSTRLNSSHLGIS